jgi:2-keto-3-deoxy-L-rhamnonate aldolase RhmA
VRIDPRASHPVPTAAFLKIAHPVVARVLAGEPAFSHLILDAEHGAFSDADLELLCGIIADVGKESIIRVPGPDPQIVGRALDRGADGVMIPRAASAAEVAGAVRGLVLTPHGLRGWDPTAAGFGYGRGARSRSAVPRCYIQIETEGALRDAGQIGGLPGVTDLFVGPADLSRALGNEGEIFSAAVVSAVEDVARRPLPADVRLGLFVDSPARARWAHGLGYRFFAVTSDVALLIQGAREVAGSVATLGRES